MVDSVPPRAIVVGVGPERGLGAALCRRFAEGGHHVLIAGPTQANVEAVATSIERTGGRATPLVTDATREEDVLRLFDAGMREDEIAAPADLVAYNVGNNEPHDLRSMEAAYFERFWRMNCFGGFLVGREAARRFVPLGRGTVLFTGASGSMRGAANFAHFGSSKAGLRAIAQSMAREFGPLGLHVAHVVIDGGIDGDRLRTRFAELLARKGEDGVLDLAAIAEAYWQLHRQHRSAWTHEIDLRPFKETF